MKLRPVLYIIGVINISIALVMVVPLIVSIIYGDGDNGALIKSLIITASSGLIFFLLFREEKIEVNHRQGFLIVALAWMDIGLFGALPYMFSGVFPSFVDAYFESASGFTTTGASVLTHIVDLPHGILFWRSMTHWLGGMGVILLYLAILPILGVGGMQLYKAEGSIVSTEKFVPRIAEMARALWLVYTVISCTLLLLLLLSGLSLFDSFIHTFGTISTGGFSNQDASIGFYQSPIVEGVVIVFMILGSTNFTLHYRFLSRGFRVYTEDEEFRFYIMMLFGASVLVAMSLRVGYYDNLLDSIRHGFFQAISIGTTTGYSTADFGRWPFFSQAMLLFIMFIGGSSGSTSGSIKCLRVLLMLKLGYRELYRLIHPHAVVPIKFGGRVVSPEVIRGVMGFTFLYLLLFAISSLLLTAAGADIVSAVSSVATTMGGVGPGLSLVGPAGNYSAVPLLGKWVLIVDMFLGRLEIYTLLILFTPAFWRG